MGTGRQRISTAGRGLAARAVGSRALAPELVLAVAKLERDPVEALELALGPAEAELGLGQVVAEPERAQAVAAPELVPVVGKLELGPVAAGLERGQVAGVPERDRVVAELERGQVPGVAVRLRTKSVIAARRHDQVPRLAAEEDLAAAAETMHAPAATEAATAWAGVVTAAEAVTAE